MNLGKVYLVGARDRATPISSRARGLRLLQAADVVVYDRLVPPQLLEETRHDAELINAGKQPTRHRLAQRRYQRSR